MAEATSKLLNYADVPKRASSSRAYRTSYFPENGNSFTAGQVVEFSLPANLNNTFCDFGNSYLRLKLTNADGADAFNLEGAGGVLGLIQKIEILTGGATISTIDNYSTLIAMFMDLDTAGQFRSNQGARMLGSANSAVGEAIASGGSRVFTCPLVLTPLFNSTKYIPLFSRDSIRIRITLNSAQRGVVGTANIADADVVLNELEFFSYQVELGADVMGMVNGATGGNYKMIMNDYRHSQATLDANATSLVATLGFSFSSLNRVLIAHRPTASANAITTVSNGNRARRGLERINLNIGGQKYPQREITESGNGAVVLAELEVSNKSLGHFSHDSSIELGAGFVANNPTGADNANTGHYMVGIDLESQRTNEGGIYSGLSTVGVVSQIEATYSAVNSACLVDAYAEYSLMLELDMNGSQVFTASV